MNLRCLILFLFLFGLCEFFIPFCLGYLIYISFLLIFSFSSAVKEVNHKIKGLRSLSIGQSLSLKSEVFSILKRESKDVVVCKLKGDNTLIPLEKQILYKNRLLGDFFVSSDG